MSSITQRNKNISPEKKYPPIWLTPLKITLDLSLPLYEQFFKNPNLPTPNPQNLGVYTLCSVKVNNMGIAACRV